MLLKIKEHDLNTQQSKGHQQTDLMRGGAIVNVPNNFRNVLRKISKRNQREHKSDGHHDDVPVTCLDIH